jgi:hypothetical protein
MQRQNTRQAMEEAANRPLDFDPKTRAQYVRDCVTQLEGYMAQGLSQEEITSRMSTFARDYKNLFETITSRQEYKQDLKMMLALLDRMGSGDLTQHQASVIVGKKVADKYIKIDQ